MTLWTAGGVYMIADYRRVSRILYGGGAPGASVGRSVFWSREGNDEFARMLVGCVVAFLNVLIVMQDWDFPDFSAGDVARRAAAETTGDRRDAAAPP